MSYPKGQKRRRIPRRRGGGGCMITIAIGIISILSLIF